jgi:hypothetical protein
MGKFKYSGKLLGEFVGFARAHRAYWIVPLVILLAGASVLIVAGQSLAPVLYTLF